ncbi:hypothetical protein STRMA_0503 [Streptococcus macacae NCTC 11558]|uniref:Uncharacterized protein n=1 Tax=Streptococcus macacae NCTC 11558 TaxID=764298 RepID=G5JZ87_9STRE|nr:hypothetical protein STRMA_0503 [Streptococcus macacae NCTC 11558]
MVKRYDSFKKGLLAAAAGNLSYVFHFFCGKLKKAISQPFLKESHNCTNLIVTAIFLFCLVILFP